MVSSLRSERFFSFLSSRIRFLIGFISRLDRRARAAGPWAPFRYVLLVPRAHCLRRLRASFQLPAAPVRRGCDWGCWGYWCRRCWRCTADTEYKRFFSTSRRIKHQCFPRTGRRCRRKPFSITSSDIECRLPSRTGRSSSITIFHHHPCSGLRIQRDIFTDSFPRSRNPHYSRDSHNRYRSNGCKWRDNHS